jgi:LCP family protein required for cell wall assembly
LLLGIGGGIHDGPNLTDTIILASIDWQKDTVTLISIPRDLWVPSLPGYVKKINEAYQIGLDDTPPDGIQKAESVVSGVTGQPIQYGVRLDFQGFVDAINQIGGVDVKVQHTLDDYNYPISGKEDDTCGHTPAELQAFTASLSASLTPDEDNFTFFPCRYKHLHFDPGLQHMDGETALEFARSRHAVGSEGTDFARSARQQLIIEAVRNKLISSAFLNPGKLLGLYNIMKSSIDTDVTQEDLGLFMDKILVLKNAKIQTAVIDFGDYLTGRAGLLDNSPVTAEYDYSAALIPRMGNGNFSEIHQYITCEITKGNCVVPAISGTPTPSPTQKKEIN